eukprot:CAMPEP_0170605932 /NCGR_PEP_ID=MMETSP0224-20130122/20234_1 /TAXON_ID=285029 /ORGANISM="Togula jolla, Strain CCCM 725" /LENGTH=36 /DNA_ID= /DNA_START= /DNA_END= /DNA_ORIENTATION=
MAQMPTKGQQRIQAQIAQHVGSWAGPKPASVTDMPR